ncbi:dynamin-1 [Phaeosphaeria sp. MPI-PUGE-AT-0046c]|nr:dynamin-1 [Phaeosphaeria sp. MPI-PUGE-AT-0046c]
MQPTSPLSPTFFEAPSRVATTITAPYCEGDTLELLQTPEQIALLDTIDELRGQGLGHHGIDLPQLIVCGEQSSGKSSLLEGLTQLRFPTGPGICTAFATEVVLRRGPEVEITIEIIPSKHRSVPECRELAKFKRYFSSREEFPFQALHHEAKVLMSGRKEVIIPGIKEETEAEFFEDALRVRYSGPDMPSFTIVDLPGFIQREWSGGDGAERVAKLVTNYMSNEKSIILAVVSAGMNKEGHHIFEHLDRYDPRRLRTIGIITKPDEAPKGSNVEAFYISLARNQERPMKHHWHTVRNRTYDERNESSTKRDELETKFFASGEWASLPKAHVGIATLRAKLSRVLLEHISMELPSLVTALQSAVESTESSLKALGKTRETTKEQRAYLVGHSVKFQMLTNDALKGNYSTPFFALATTGEHSSIRLRTAIQNLNFEFAQTMEQKGHTWNITSAVSTRGRTADLAVGSHLTMRHYGACFNNPMSIDRADFLEDIVGDYVRQSRPSGLPSLVNPWVIGEVFRQQSRNWSNIAKHHLQEVYHAVQSYIEDVLGSLFDPRTRNLLLLKQIRPELEKRWRNAELKLDELLVPYTEQDPVAYDIGFIQDLHQMKTTRYQVNMEAQTGNMRQDFVTQNAAKSSQRLLTESLDDCTNSDILDMMQTYYKSAISVFINNIAVLAIENCLIKDLSSIFSPTLTANMDDEQLHAIAAECEETRTERGALQQKLAVLQSGKQILYEHIGMFRHSLLDTSP